MGPSKARNGAKLISDAILEKLGLEFEIGFNEKVLLGEPDNVLALESLGNAYTRCGRVEDGLGIDRRLVTLLPESAIARYNLACSLSLLARVDEAIEALTSAVRLGYRDFEYLERDPDLENVRRDARYRAVIRAK
jgi:hypothetical protein